MSSVLSLFRRKKIGLALGGGAVWGTAHIGILKAIDELKIPISCISGTSAGSLVGALYASGMSPSDMENIASTTNWSQLTRPSLPKRGILSTEPMEDFLKKIFTDLYIENLKIPFSAIAVDAVEGKEIIFSKGYLPTALRASCSIPGIFRPVEQGKMLLIDGGIMDNVPVTPVRKLGADIVIAVNLSPDLNKWIPKNTAGLILKSFLLAQHANSIREMTHAEIVINVNTKKISPADFRCTKELIDIGYNAAISVLNNNHLTRV
ncbi:MAG: patatin-like phospholipase family protein [Clostridiales bacterium]|nr:patatin-like phospholipase family protein [Clostridiales bacterium]